jgi:hypothetical protein
VAVPAPPLVIPTGRTGIDALLAGPANSTQVLARVPVDAARSGVDATTHHASGAGARRSRVSQPGHPPRAGSRSRPWLILAVVLTLAAAGVGGWYYLRENERSATVQATLRADREVVDSVLLGLATAATTSAVRTAAAPAVAQSRQHASTAAVTTGGDQASDVRLMGRALEVLASLRTLTADSLDAWPSRQTEVAAALRAAPTLAADSKAIDAALANISAVVSRGQAALASWQEETTNAEQEAAGSVAELDEYALAVHSEIDRVRRAQQAGGADLRDSDFGPMSGYASATAAAEALADDLDSVVDNLEGQPRLAAVSWQHDEVLHAVTALSTSATNLGIAFSQASDCRAARQATPTPLATAPASPSATGPAGGTAGSEGPGTTTTPATPTATTGAAAPAAPVDTSACDQRARDAWDDYGAAAVEQGPALDSAISAWESRVAERRDELGSVSGPPRPEV